MGRKAGRVVLVLVAVVALGRPVVPQGAQEDTAERVLAALNGARAQATAPALARRVDLDTVALTRARRIAELAHPERLRDIAPLGDDLRQAGVAWYRRVAAHTEMVRGYERPEDGLVSSWRGVASAWDKAVAAEYDAVGLATWRAEDGWIVLVAVLLDEMPAPPAPGAIEESVAARVNRERAERGLAPLASSVALSDVARGHSVDMARRGYLSHVDPDGAGPADRVERAGIAFYRVAENIHWSRGEPGEPGEMAVRSWLASPGHRQAMLDAEVTRTGVGVAVGADGGIHVTQLFLLPQ